jgi:hypothetical protein
MILGSHREALLVAVPVHRLVVVGLLTVRQILLVTVLQVETHATLPVVEAAGLPL